MAEYLIPILLSSLITSLGVYLMPDNDHGSSVSRGLRFCGGLCVLAMTVLPLPRILGYADSLLAEMDLPAEEREAVMEEREELIFIEAKREFEEMTRTLIERRFPEEEFELSVLADRELGDIEILITYHSDAFPTEEVKGYVQSLYSDTVGVRVTRKEVD